MAFVAINPSGPLLVGKSDGKNQAIGEARHEQWLKNKLALPGAERESGPLAAAEEDYANRAFPAAYVPFKLTLNAHGAFNKVKTRSNANSSSNIGTWTLIGPSTTNFPDVLTFSGPPMQTPAASPRWRSIQTAIIPIAVFGWQPQAAASGAPTMRFPRAELAGHLSPAVSRRMRSEH